MGKTDTSNYWLGSHPEFWENPGGLYWCDNTVYSKEIDATLYSGLTIDFKWFGAASSSSNELKEGAYLCYSIDGGATFIDFPSIYNDPPHTIPVITQTVTAFDISVVDNKKFHIGFRWISDDGYGPDLGFTVDDIVIKAAGALPIELLSQSAKCTDKGVEFSWSTATETNNDYFTIERSADGYIFEELGTVKGAGNSNQVLSYSFIDDNFTHNFYYYRLKQTDFDGTSITKPVLALGCENEDVTNLSIGYGASHISTVLNNPIQGNVYTISLIAVSGAIVKTDIITDFDTNIRYQIENEYLSKGVYFVSFRSETDFFIEKIEVR